MCITKFKIKRKAGFPFFGKDYVFAPCGKCEDCRKHSQYAWAWRLTSDIQYYVKEKGYRVGFITLTYNDAHLPRFPQYFEDGTENPLFGQPCFSKKDTEDLILYIRKVSHRERGIKDWLYFLACEFGPATQRPHMHMIIAWPEKSIKIVRQRGTGKILSKVSYINDAEYVHELIRHYWVEYAGNGFISPDTPQGGNSKRSGKKYLPFEVKTLSDCMSSAFYTAKYVTKDIYFLGKISEVLPYSDRWKDSSIKDYLPHHRQTKSLGFRSVASLSDAQKIELLNKGKILLGSDKLSLPPMYIKNKLMFKPCYFVNAKGERLVKQECTDFFKRHFHEIMDRKVEYFKVLFDSWKDENYWLSSGLDEDDAMDAAWFVRMNDRPEKFGCSLAEAYVYYFGLPWKMCFRDKKLTYQNRYLFNALLGVSFEKIYEFEWKNIQEFFNHIMVFVGWKQESTVDEKTDYLKDLMNQPMSEVG